MNNIADPLAQVHKWRRFGAAGPVYEVLGWGKKVGDEQFVRIHVFDSGEDADYKLKDMLDDPEEH